MHIRSINTHYLFQWDTLNNTLSLMYTFTAQTHEHTLIYTDTQMAPALTTNAV